MSTRHYYDITLRLTCKACAEMIADDMRRRYPMGGAVFLVVSDFAIDDEKERPERANIRSLGQMSYWPDVEPCAEHAAEWAKHVARLPEIESEKR